MPKPSLKPIDTKRSEEMLSPRCSIKTPRADSLIARASIRSCDGRGREPILRVITSWGIQVTKQGFRTSSRAGWLHFALQMSLPPDQSLGWFSSRRFNIATPRSRNKHAATGLRKVSPCLCTLGYRPLSVSHVRSLTVSVCSEVEIKAVILRQLSAVYLFSPIHSNPSEIVDIHELGRMLS